MFLKHYVNIRGKKLTLYRFSNGGGMLGSYCIQTIREHDESHALLRTEDCKDPNEEAKITEKLIDVAVLAELEAVVRKHKMNHWNGKRLCKDFVHDGETQSYCLEFGNAAIRFSSQIYPEEYRKKVNELHEIIKKYI